jgi:hypothetical protein
MAMPVVSGSNEFNENAFVLPSGVTIGGMTTSFNQPDIWRIDLNGTKPPNVDGVDILRWFAPEFDSSGQIINCGGRKLGCVDTNAGSTNRYNSLIR